MNCINKLKGLSIIHDTDTIDIIINLESLLLQIFKKIKVGEIPLERIYYIKNLDFSDLNNLQTILNNLLVKTNTNRQKRTLIK